LKNNHIREATLMLENTHKSGLEKIRKIDNTQMETRTSYDIASYYVTNKWNALSRNGMSHLEASALLLRPDLRELRMYYASPGERFSSIRLTLPFSFWYDYYFNGKLPGKRKFLTETLPTLVFGYLLGSQRPFKRLEPSFSRFCERFNHITLSSFVENYFTYDDTITGRKLSMPEGYPGVVVVPEEEAISYYELLKSYKEGKRGNLVPDFVRAVYETAVFISRFEEREKEIETLLSKSPYPNTNLILVPHGDVQRVFINVGNVLFDEDTGRISDKVLREIAKTHPKKLYFSFVASVHYVLSRNYYAVVPLADTRKYSKEYPAVAFRVHDKHVILPKSVRTEEAIERIKKTGKKPVFVPL